MATLNRHKGIEKIYITPRNVRYAICKDGKILTKPMGQIHTWKLADPSITEELLASKFPIDTSSQAQAIITSVNADAHAREASKRIRRLSRR